MLVLSRRENEEVILDIYTDPSRTTLLQTIIVSVLESTGAVKLGFEAALNIRITRKEIHDTSRSGTQPVRHL